jgi:hypothetical protein
MRNPIELPDSVYLNQALSYDKDTGELTWKLRPPCHFKNKNGYETFNGQFAGKKAGSVSKNGYLKVSIDGVSYLAHRLIYKMKKGVDPSGEVDHRDTNRLNNKWKNLRASTSSQNQHNASIRKDNKTGFKGVHFHKKRNMYVANVRLGGDTVYREFFDTPEEAYKARCKAVKKLHKKFARNETRNIAA